MNKNVLIPQFEGKDLLEGAEFKSFKRFKATLDYSLELIKMQEVYKKVFRNNRFVFKNHQNPKDRKMYSDMVISVTFTYNTKDYSVRQIRENLYRDGFEYNGNHYVRYKRSGGSARVGKCLFIREELFAPMMKWSYMGLKYKEDEVLDLASIEAYIALTTSSIIDTIQIKPENILLIDDYDSVFKDKVMSVSVENKRLVVKPDEVNVVNSIFDGQSLLDSSMFVGEYQDKGMLLLRNRFFKSCCFNSNVQKFFKDNNIKTISQLNGKTLAKSVGDIKLITTPSSIKYLKFGNFETYMDLLEPTFGIVKYEKPPFFMNGEMVQTHYQLLNTLEMSYDETEEFLEDTFDYILLLKQDLGVLRLHLKMKLGEDVEIHSLDTSSDFIYTMLQINDKISQTSMFYKFRKDLIDSYVRNVRKGHILVDGNYSVLMGNGYEMLKHSIGDFDGQSTLGKDEVVSKRFDVGKELLAVRSPHITMGNLWVVNNVEREEYVKYFNLTEQIIAINSIGCNVLERLNGADYDSDTVLLTDNPMLINKAKQNYNKFLVPTSLVESKKVERKNNSWHRYDLDEKTSVNKIGEIVNMSQILNSRLWEIKKSGGNYEDIYKDICKLAVMSCIEIDKAKKEFTVNNAHELRLLKKKYPELMKEKPMFFYHLPTNDTNIIKDSEKHRQYETTMDYLEDIVTKRIRKIRANHSTKLEIKDLLSPLDEKQAISSSDKKQATRIIKDCDNLALQTRAIWADESLQPQEKYIRCQSIKDEFIHNLKSKKVTPEVVYRILYSLPSRIQRKMLLLLFTTHRSVVIGILHNSKSNVNIICKNDDFADTQIYGKKYQNIQF